VNIVETEKGAAPVPSEVPECEFCGSKMLLHDFTLRDEKLLLRIKCLKCSFLKRDEVTISEAERDALGRSQLLGKVLLKGEVELVARYFGRDVEETVRKQLESWGYW